MNDEEPEETFTFRDRRRVSADAPPTPVTPAEPAPVTPVATVETPTSVLAAGDDDIATSPFPLDESGADMELPDEGEFPGMDAPGELPDVYSVLALFLSELRNLAWLRMGLLANPGTGQIERDMDQARVAIDTVTFLASKLDLVVSPEERPQLKSLVSDLQVNFVEQTRRGT